MLTMAKPNREILGGKWVYTIKSGPNNEETYKARYVAKCYSQVLGVDCHETFALTARTKQVHDVAEIQLKEIAPLTSKSFGAKEQEHDPESNRVTD